MLNNRGEVCYPDGENVRRGAEDPGYHEDRLCLKCQWGMQGM